ncbi:hypothetical protein, variant [Verruconis gallopava]|uniref:Rab-GAP TBC domain-containing protein n=1 Tax=Verruconis gallopava TaxID=253628 RepID=A0A0D1Z1Y3_9PEZI|nr:uncharacterized protein PV09_02599 [Verruconis gallopava]XP_016216807.1 hypothetical protein, variant [Verruconis gallopava]KIW06937.1 hypothetical protein PV09_02599 [Verruconis gallopava]KIW06938.1 hypothetical protein, variant [Verruconis gallopava]
MDSKGAKSIRGKRSASHIAASASSRRTSTEAVTGSPKVLTSFPSLSPDSSASPVRRKRSSREATRSNNSLVDGTIVGHLDRRSSASRSCGPSRRTSSEGSNPETPVQPRKQTSSIGKTLRGAASLHKSILAGLTFRSSAQEDSPGAVFKDPDWNAADPLENASDDQVQRVIENHGGPISILRQYSKDLAECNARIATERNMKLDLMDQNRRLRDENELLKLQLEEQNRKYKNVQNLFKRFVRPEYPGQIQIVDSPNGHYVLDSTNGEMIEPQKPSTRSSKPASIRTVGSGTSSNVVENLLNKPPTQDASVSLKAIAARNKRESKDGRKESRSNRGSVSLRPDSLELRAPIEVETLPPALRDDKGASYDIPIDRLGFFFTASRETRQQEALPYQPGELSESSSVNSFPVSDDDIEESLKTPNSQDDASSYLVSTGASNSGELLCYAPSGPAVRFISNPSGGVRMFIDVSGPNTPTAEMTRSTSSEILSQSTATIVPTSASGTMVTPTKASESTRALNALLEKLNEAHDRQQRIRMSEWMAFHTQLRANIPAALARASSDYGMADISRLCSKGTVSAETWKKFNTLIVSGIPISLRREVWMERSGANSLLEPGKFQALLSETELAQSIRNEIAADVERTLGNNVYFRNGIGKTKLTDVLVAYAQYNPTIGYSQGLNIIAANLLLMLPSAEDAFWLLAAIIENILPPEYYDQDGMVSSRALDTDGKVLISYVVDLLGNNLHKHLRTHMVNLDMFTPGWFISAFAACLSGEPLYRIWDILFGLCDGRYMFCFALALLKINKRGLLACKDSEELMLYLGGKMTNAAVGLDVLIREGVRMGGYVTKEDLEKRREAVRASANG